MEKPNFDSRAVLAVHAYMLSCLRHTNLYKWQHSADYRHLHWLHISATM